ncbi:RING finger and WD repeat domain-containing protein 3, partial [Conglomerata obtusa]
MEDDEADCCPICLSEYTVEEIHRPTSLKCGHIFGNQCLANWSKRKGSLLCPTCFAKNRKSDVRILYGTSLRIYDTSHKNDLLQKFIDEKSKNEKLQQENLHLKTSIDYFQAEIIRYEQMHDEKMKNNDIIEDEKNDDYIFFAKINDKNAKAIILSDNVNGKIFISSRNSTSVGYKILESNYCSFEYVKLFERKKDACFISDMKMSTFNDGLMLVSYANEIKLINSCTNNILIGFETKNNVKAICFDTRNRTMIFYADDIGFLHIYDLIKLCDIQTIFLSKNINTICRYKNKIVVNCLTKWYFIDDKTFDINENETLY